MADAKLKDCEAIYEMAKQLNPRDLDIAKAYVACLLTVGDPKETKRLIDGEDVQPNKTA